MTGAFTNSLIVLGVMLAVLVAGSFMRKIPVAVLLVLASIAGAVVGGLTDPNLWRDYFQTIGSVFVGNGDTYPSLMRHFMEGSLLFLNLMLTVAAGMVFMNILKENGSLNLVTRTIVSKFYWSPSLLLIVIMILIMGPAMLTGSAPASVLSTGILVLPILLEIGVSKDDAAAVIAMGSLFGMVAPPVNVPAMLIGTGVYMPYENFATPLLLLTMPLAIFSVLYIARGSVSKIDKDAVLAKIPGDPEVKGFIPWIPLIFLIVYMAVKSSFPQIDPGTPLVFCMGIIVALLCSKKKINFFKVSADAMAQSIDVMALFAAVGMMIQIMGLTGARGATVVGALGLKGPLLYLSIALVAPFVGGLLMPFGCAGVLGIPLIMAFTNKSAIFVTSALTLIMCIGALLPPTSVSGQFAARAVGLENQSKMLKKCLLPAILSLLLSVFFMVYANEIVVFLRSVGLTWVK